MPRNGRINRRAGWIAGVALAAIATVAQAQSDRHDFNIPSERASDALNAFSKQSGYRLLFPFDAVDGKVTRPVVGNLKTEQALNQLLADTGLVVAGRSDNVITLKAPDGRPSEASKAQASEATALDEVIVTATKRPEAARKISGSVTAVTGQQLEQIGAVSFSDYLTRTPGVVFNQAVPGLSTVTIRGVSTTTLLDQGQGTTGYFINDVPLTDPYFTVAVPDIDAFDVDNVTVLRGPQGTLFGSASLGGAINYQAAKPNLSDYQVHAQGTVESVDHGDTGYSGKLMVNLPIVQDKLAVRGVFVYRNDAGFIDNIGTGVENSNKGLTRGARIEATWRPTDSTTVNYMFLRQTQNTADQPYEQPVYAGPLEKSTAVPETANFATTIHNLRVDQELGFATLTATATYHQKDQYLVNDLTTFLGPLLGNLANPVTGPQDAYAHGVTFEARLASPTGRRFEYLIGAMHDDTKENFIDTFVAPNAANVIEMLYAPIFGAGIGQLSAPNDTIFTATLPFEGKESAVFGEATYHFSDELKLTVGGRAFKTSTDNVSTASGFVELLLGGVLTDVEQGHQEESGFTPKVSLTWTPKDDILVYGLYSQGFRFGGPNINPGVPKTFKSDSLDNYEIGVRSNWWDRRLQLDVTGFYIDWSDIQLRLATPLGLAYAANAGKARNYGVETTGTLRPVPGLTLQANVTYLNATLRQDFDPGAGQPIVPAGSVLPGSSKWQVSDSASYTWDSLPFEPTLTLLHRYVSQAPGPFNQTFPVTQGDYNVFDLRLSGQFHGAEITAFVQNIGDERGVATASAAPGSTWQRYLIRPRTIGLTFDYKM